MKLIKHTHRIITCTLALFLAVVAMQAQTLIMHVTPKANPCPPQAALYLTNPGRFFNISIENPSDEALDVFLVIRLKQVVPAGLTLSTPVNKQPEIPIHLPPSTTTVLTQIDLKNVFNNISIKDCIVTGGELENFLDGSTALLPEGSYTGNVIAYRWSNNTDPNPSALSDPETYVDFDICYKANAPVINDPTDTGMDTLTEEQKAQDPGFRAEFATAPILNFNSPVHFAWTASALSCSTIKEVKYTMEFFRLYPNLLPDEASSIGKLAYYSIDNGSKTDYLYNQLPTISKSTFLEGEYYALRIKATTPYNDPTTAQYVYIENNGYSPFLVFRVAYGTHTTDTLPPIPPIKKEKNWKATVTVPKLTNPDNEGNGMKLHKIEKGTNLDPAWEKPAYVEGDKDFYAKLKFKYTVSLHYVAPDLTDIDSIGRTKALWKQEDITDLSHDLKWNDFYKEIEVGKDYMLIVNATPTNAEEGEVAFTTPGLNCYTFGIYLTEAEVIGKCDDEHVYEDFMGVSFGEKIEKPLEVTIGNFKLTITEATGSGITSGTTVYDAGKIVPDTTGRKSPWGPTYKGSGYITWAPYGQPLKIAVDFSSITINQKKQVIDGDVKSSEIKDQDVIPYDLINWSIYKTTGKSLDVSKYATVDDVKDACGKYWDAVKQGAGYTNLITQLSENMIGVDLNSKPFNLPMGMPTKICPDLPFDISLMSMEFTPQSSSAALLILFKMPDSKPGDKVSLSEVLAFTAPRLCITPNSLWTATGVAGLLYDMAITDNSSGYTFTFKAPTDYTKLDNGCYVGWADNKFTDLGIDVTSTIPGLLNADRTAQPVIEMKGLVHKWEDFILGVDMEPFQIESAPGYIFSPGKGLVYDHSRARNPEGVKFPGDYNWEKWGLQGSISKAPIDWMGFYAEEISMTFPQCLEASDDGAFNSDKGIKMALSGMLIDKSGCSLTASVTNILDVKTAKLGGWALTLDSVYVDVVQSNFKSSGFAGTFKLPLFDSNNRYSCQISLIDQSEADRIKRERKQAAINQEESTEGKASASAAATPATGEGKGGEKKLHLTFRTQPIDKMNFDFFLGDAHIDKNGTYLNIDYLDGVTEVEFLASGTITLGSSNDKGTGGKVKGVPFEIPGVRFAGFRLSNFAYRSGFAQTYAKTLDKDDAYKADLEKKLSDQNNKISDNLYFSVGKWSLASMKKTICGIPFELKDIDIKHDNGCTGLYINGGVGLIGNVEKGTALGGTAGLTIWAKVDINTNDISKSSIHYDHISFNEIDIKGSFGGGKIKAEGMLAVDDDDEKKGFKGSLSFDVASLFKLEAAGGYYSVTKTEADLAVDGKDEDAKGNKSYNAAFFYADMSGKAGIPVGPVTINGISGGFYFNYRVNTASAMDDPESFKKALAEPTIAYKAYGGAFGLEMSMGDKELCKGVFNLVIAYDAAKDKLAEFHLRGKVDVMAGNSDKGLITAQADILYEDNTSDEKKPDECRSFTLLLQADASADIATAYESFTGTKLPDIPTSKAGLEELGQEGADDAGDGSDNKEKSATNADGTRTKSDAEEKAEQKGDLPSSGAHLSLEIQYRYYPNATSESGKKKWHVYLGEPDENKRCRMTFIDFSLCKSCPIGVWGTLYANAYLCLGNELPNNGALPALPQKVQDALYGGGTSKNVTTDKNAASSLEKARYDMIHGGGPNGKIKGGIQFGVAIGADFGCNALFCYARVEGIAGFDAVLKQYACATCSDGSTMGGKNGYYAMAQVYAMLHGEVGLMLDLGFWSGKVPLADVTLGAVLKGGFPNPAWVYGKVRAKGSVLCGLIKFNKSVELKAGKVCVPIAGSPLDNIEIFGDYSFGSDKKEDGWNKGNAVSHLSTPSFTTNMRMDAPMTLIDENKKNDVAGLDGDEGIATAAATRTYVFHLDKGLNFKSFNGPSTDNMRSQLEVTYSTQNHTSYNVNTGTLDPNTYYELDLHGFCKEIVNGKEVDPIFKDKESNYKDVHRPWGQDLNLYFVTGEPSNNVNDYVEMFTPYDLTSAVKEEAANPTVSLAYDLSEQFSNPDYEYYATLEYQTRKYVNGEFAWQYSDLQYNDNNQRMGSQRSKFEHMPVEQHIEEGNDANGNAYKYVTIALQTPLQASDIRSNTTYRYRIFKIDHGTVNKYLAKIDTIRKNIMTDANAAIADANSLLKDLGGDDSENMKKELLSYYADLTTQFGKDEAEQRATQLVSDALGQKFTEQIFSHSFTTGQYNTIAEKLQSKSSNEVFHSNQTVNGKENKYGSLCFKITGFVHKWSGKSMEFNPYYAMNYWNSVLLCPGNSKGEDAPEYRLNQASTTPCSLITFSLGGDEYRNNGSPETRTWTNSDFEHKVSPEMCEKWISFTSPMKASDVSNSVGGSIARMYWADATMVDLMQNQMNYYFVELTKAKNGEARTTDALITYNNDWYMRWRKRNEDYVSQQLKINPRAPLWGGESSTATFPVYQLSLMFCRDVASHFKVKDGWLTTEQIGRDATDSYKYMAKDKTLFNLSKSLEDLQGVTFQVYRPTGYNIACSATMGPGLRPSTSGTSRMSYTVSINPIDARTGNTEVRTTTTEIIDDLDIPDKYFREIVLANFDKNKNGRLEKAEVDAITNLHVVESRVASLAGMESMKNLKSIHFDGLTKITKLDFSYNRQLTYIFIHNMNLTTLDVSHLENLDHLSVNSHNWDQLTLPDNQMRGLESLDVSHNSKLTILDVNGNQLTQLDVAKNPALTTLSCMGNLIEDIDISNNTHLTNISIGRQYKKKGSDYTNKGSLVASFSPGMSSLADIILKSGGYILNKNSFPDNAKNVNYSNANVAIHYSRDKIENQLDSCLACYLYLKYGNGPKASRGIDKTNLSSVSKYWSLDYDKLAKETQLNCAGYRIKSLKNLELFMPRLTSIDCSDNKIEELDATPFTNLQVLNCSKNKLVTIALPSRIGQLNASDNALLKLDCKGLNNLTVLQCNNNPVNELYIGDCHKIERLEISKCDIQALDLSSMASLMVLNCSGNSFSASSYSLGLILPTTAPNFTTFMCSDVSQQSFSIENLSRFSKLTLVDVSNNPYLQSIDLPASLKTLNIEGTSIKSINLSDNLEVLKAAGSMLSGTSTQAGNVLILTTGFIKNLKYLDVSDALLDRILVTGNSSNLSTFYAGVPKRMKGKKVEVVFYKEASPLSGKWQSNWRLLPQNENAVGHMVDEKPANLDSQLVLETITKEDLEMKKDLGTLYDEFKQQYAPNTRVLHTKDLKAITKLNLSKRTLGNEVANILKWMPAIETLDLTKNGIQDLDLENCYVPVTSNKSPSNTLGTVDISMIPNANYMSNLDLSDNQALKSLKLPQGIKNSSVIARNTSLDVAQVLEMAQRYTTLVDVSGSPALDSILTLDDAGLKSATLNVSNTSISRIIIGSKGTGSLTTLNAANCLLLRNIDIATFSGIKAIDLTGSPCNARFNSTLSASQWFDKFASKNPNVKVFFKFLFLDAQTKYLEVTSYKDIISKMNLSHKYTYKQYCDYMKTHQPAQDNNSNTPKLTEQGGDQMRTDNKNSKTGKNPVIIDNTPVETDTTSVKTDTTSVETDTTSVKTDTTSVKTDTTSVIIVTPGAVNRGATLIRNQAGSSIPASLRGKTNRGGANRLKSDTTQTNSANNGSLNTNLNVNDSKNKLKK